MPKRSPKWTRDELILALNLYFEHPPDGIDVKHPDIIALSQLLNALPIYPLIERGPDFRNPNGVHMKLFNFQDIDPCKPPGLPAGSRLDKEIWDEFAHDRSRLQSVAQAIRATVQPSAMIGITQLDATEDGVSEGRILLQVHRIRERNASLVKKKKHSVLTKTGKLACEVCGFVYAEMYGALGKDFIECHHTVPLSQSQPGERTKLSDLALVCANCHRMLHVGQMVLTIVQLQAIVAQDQDHNS
jgi:5-methylcytosine-specific restriction enzyme A